MFSNSTIHNKFLDYIIKKCIRVYFWILIVKFKIDSKLSHLKFFSKKNCSQTIVSLSAWKSLLTPFSIKRREYNYLFL